MVYKRLHVTDLSPDSQPKRAEQASTTCVSIGEVVPILLAAAQEGRVWLDDFANDQVTLPRDLHDVLMAYHHFRTPSV